MDVDIMLKNMVIPLSISFIFMFTAAISASNHKITKLSEIDAVEIELANGIKVNLKAIDESEEVLVRGIAPGGYSVLSPKDRSSGKVSARIAWESGFGKWNYNEVSNKLLNDFLELEIALAPFHRTIDGAALPSKLQQLLIMIERLYSAPRFDSNAQSEVLSRLSDSVKLRHRDPETLFEDVIRCTNTGDLAILHPITAEDLEQVNYQTAKKYYLEHFLSTDDLTFLIVGEFDVEEVIPLVIKYLGAIPKRHAPTTTNSTPHPTVPSGLTKREITSPFLQECIMRMTFALSLELTENSWQQLETASQVIETRLRSRFREIMGATQGIDVAYEFPYYPS
ncbi:MAG: insulinase family protein, partial [Nitrosomonas sp.]